MAHNIDFGEDVVAAATDAGAIISFTSAAAEAAQALEELRPGVWRAPNGNIFDLEQYDERPRTLKANVVLNRPQSLGEYLARHRSEATSLWVDTATGTHTAVIDGDEEESLPGWRRHQATLELQATEAWARWTGKADRWLDQATFVELLEVAALAATPEVLDPPANELATLVATLSATITATVKTSDIGDGGNRSITYEETARTRGKGNAELPTKLTLRLAPFEGVEYAAELTARLHIKAVAGETPAFRYSILHVARALEQAITKVTEDVTELAYGSSALGDLPVYYGRPA